MASDDSDLLNVAMLIDELKVSVKSTQSAFNVHRTGRTDTFPVAMDSRENPSSRLNTATAKIPCDRST